jgi:hypothetical protein
MIHRDYRSLPLWRSMLIVPANVPHFVEIALDGSFHTVFLVRRHL